MNGFLSEVMLQGDRRSQFRSQLQIICLGYSLQKAASVALSLRARSRLPVDGNQKDCQIRAIQCALNVNQPAGSEMHHLKRAVDSFGD